MPKGKKKKLDAKAKVGIVVGYNKFNRRCCRAHKPETVHVTFDEERFQAKEARGDGGPENEPKPTSVGAAVKPGEAKPKDGPKAEEAAA